MKALNSIQIPEQKKNFNPKPILMFMAIYINAILDDKKNFSFKLFPRFFSPENLIK